MARPSFKTFLLLTTIITGAVFFNKYAIKDGLIFFPESFMKLGNYLFIKAESFGGFMEKIKNFNRLASENDKLKQNQEAILGLKARVDDLEDENGFLRRSGRIAQKFDHPVVYAGIFNLNLAPAGYNVLLNKGAQDGVSVDDVVVTAEGILVGKIQKVMRNFSRVLFVSDPELKITAKTLNSGTTGIVRGALGEGMYFDFVIQEDEIKEGDVLISTGNDMFPPALVIGSVENIEVNATQIFKKIRIRPAIKDTQLGRVLVIKLNK
ncbi:MAG: rod shape-determining protein MreC [Candidatus Yanofskybacteria bacterium RIFCSPLOWO2_02_FULL_43_10]|uniref:Cell shape-determining protein MreC n=1 Tax=Candidatus Yanofskybacteria bacterium RIFCSPLOWO2_12_FULL_43_11b TaxID=1802710 RepID=A0A1F8HB21_9BACT|nr:MAG: rod shape-determining protein MreC [Candidatus Yanofskybacteria bacterium RIFCSPHIGHO2_01_FULL_43_32]OGN11295.1 MAG: rod shape-determining protein MreC [Candidatus Yanofskybacteria bacterium RIFCSPHIGHO2_02_FULL_43_12]OGN18372.1 MAG: rod shape-determining protein MreC [Candidatus Yanofskybacteria bacterium RIFCSPHIGHO2_12_FULL_43_11]OGN24217.1 MAG: rod shape-determining protein MreC [Candidatus Yanofskybacteria bacterium RIFCSPLOWO2_01_FULL_43_46]OGN30661.1 MAG: rod shape-determining pr